MDKIVLFPKDIRFKIVFQYVYSQFIKNWNYNYIVDFSPTLNIDLILERNHVEIKEIKLTEELLSFIILNSKI